MPTKGLPDLRHLTRGRPSLRAVWAVLIFGIFLSLAISSGPALAQQKILGVAAVDDTTRDLLLSPYTLVQFDPDTKVTPQSIEDSGGKILSGAISPSNMINLGFDGKPAWLTIRIANTGYQHSWVLDLGRRSQGRLGYLKSARAYEMEIGAQGTEVQEIKPLDDKGAFEFQIPKGTQKYILLNIVPAAGRPAVLPVRLYSQQAYLDHVQSYFTAFSIHSFFLLVFAIFFASVALSQAKRSQFVFAAFFIYEAIIWSVTENMGAIVGFTLFDVMIPCMMLGFSLFSIILTKLFFDIEGGTFAEKYVLYGLAWLNILASILAFLLPVSDGLTQTALLYGAPLITLSILSLMAFAQAFNGTVAHRFYFIGTVFPLLGLVLVFLGFVHILPHHPFFINALWYSVSFQGFFMALAIYKKNAAVETSVISVKNRSGDELDFSKIREARDSGDHSRLLKVIEKEREQLADFRAKEIERVNEMRKAKEIADEANRAKSAFLAVVSHEIRTPMTGVMGMVKLLLDSSITKQQRDYVLTIQESSEAMLALLNDILDFERIQRGKIELENISFDLHRLIQGLITLMSGHAAEKGILLSARVDDDLPKFVKGDPTRLRQVLLNLMGNAIKFTNDGSVTLLVKNMNSGESDLKDPNHITEKYMIYFAVQDTGIGIPVEAQQNLFTPFAQANSSISRKFGGSGLGLAISKGLIETMGSAINISSKEGEGSTFFFTLEMQRGIAVAGEKPANLSAPHPVAVSQEKPVTPLKILVVDDNQITRKVMIGFLSQGKHEIITADSAEDALKKINQDAFDLIFMDIELPELKGNEATKMLREHRDRVKAGIPVIAMTGNVAIEDRERYLADGMTGFLAKPIEADQLNAIVSDIAHKSYEREIRMPSATGFDPFAGTPEDLAAFARKIEEIPHDRNIFNPDMLQSLKDTIGAPQLNELLDELIVKTDEILQAMILASDNNDFQTLAARSHELKGMAGNFGLVEISALAAQTERKAKNSDTSDLGTLVGSLPDASLRAQNALKLWSAA